MCNEVAHEFCPLAMRGRVMFADAYLGIPELNWLTLSHLALPPNHGNAILSRSTHASGKYKERAIRVLDR